MNLLAEVRSLSKKMTKNNFQSKRDDYINRITKLMIKESAMGNDYVLILKIPYRRELLAMDSEIFKAIAKHFASLGFWVAYDYINEDGNQGTFATTSNNKSFPDPVNPRRFPKEDWEDVESGWIEDTHGLCISWHNRS